VNQPTKDELTAVTAEVRQCASTLLDCLGRTKGDPVPCREEIQAAIQRLLKQPFLFQAGQKRPSAHADAACMLYFDPGLMIAMAQSHSGQTETPHNHGVWLATAVYEGEVLYRGFERVDDRSRMGHADLRIVEDRVLRAGDVALTPPPPHDIHETVSLTQNTMMVVTGGNFAVLRDYYDVKEKRYATR
jgi:predicted metal-dependent enzyme (double-stranded beta helix superfamily)